MANVLLRLASGLFCIDAKPHEQPSRLVGASCLLFAIPSMISAVNGDFMTSVWLLFVTSCSFMADFWALGTAWNIVDRWVANSFTVYLMSKACRYAPLLTALNLFPVAGILTYARMSKTHEQWRFRHSLWHVAMMFDIGFFLSVIYAAERELAVAGETF
eukprot:TRINITY_DN56704_c0_g1_i1.p1 TRINITY_DN56704_c0_g1~~TRINITY_DN56704_c0_g1_i1.p1  ORF type:complete len:173 (+),score=35.79 TRINITY_DN56704_c0_g1_i1:44-520(+)